MVIPPTTESSPRASKIERLAKRTGDWKEIRLARGGRAHMDANDLRILEAVTRIGSMNRAAAELNMVQSIVTSRIRLLDGRGTPLKRIPIGLEDRRVNSLPRFERRPQQLEVRV